MGSEAADRDLIVNARSLYVHVPFCRRICPYCDFAVTSPARAPFSHSAFVELIRIELERLPRDLRIRTLYLGGGTPSALEPEDLTRLVTSIRERHDLSRLVEASIEVNPEDVTPEKARLFRDLGFTRTSLGVQSFDPRSLAILGRRHARDDVVQATDRLRRAGIDNINFDLIIAHPTQTPERLSLDLTEALALSPSHISCYAMTFEPGTPYARAQARGSLPSLSEDLESDLLRLARSRLENAGWLRYEISNFARPGFRSIHNLAYWKRSPYLGIGPSAASFDGVRRWQNPKNLREWADAVRRGEKPEPETLDLSSRLLEAIMLGLRRPHGVRWARIRREFAEGLPRDFERRVDALVAAGLLETSPTSLRPTARGIELADAVTLELLTDHDPDRRQP